MTSSSRLFPTVEASAVPWLSVEQMREVDRIMVEELGISLVRMMENAGRSLAQVARKLLGGDTAGRSILVLAGPGGNGGGGLVAARHLAGAGAQVAVALSGAAEGFAPVPAEQLAIARQLAIPIHEDLDSLGEAELVIDALLGARTDLVDVAYFERDAVFGTDAVPFTLDSRVTNTTREYAHLLDDVVKGRRPGACPRRLPLPELGRARLHSRSESRTICRRPLLPAPAEQEPLETAEAAEAQPAARIPRLMP
jgi:hypothetical protein